MASFCDYVLQTTVFIGFWHPGSGCNQLPNCDRCLKNGLRSTPFLQIVWNQVFTNSILQNLWNQSLRGKIPGINNLGAENQKPLSRSGLLSHKSILSKIRFWGIAGTHF